MRRREAKGNPTEMTEREEFLWRSYKRLSKRKIAKALRMSAQRVDDEVQKVGLYYFGSRWRQQLSEDLYDDKLADEYSQDIIRERCQEIRDTWSDRVRNNREVQHNPPARVQVVRDYDFEVVEE